MFTKNNLKGLRVLITAGPTREYLDPVRFLTNDSSGEMGYQLAKVFSAAGSQVEVVLGPVSPRGFKWNKIKVIPVVSSLEMSRAVKKRLPQSQVFLATAAVLDWRFKKYLNSKLKKRHQKTFTLKLNSTPDILRDAGAWKSKRNGKIRWVQANGFKPPLLVGFALETENLKKEALKKLTSKNLDLIIGNTPRSFSNPRIKPLWVEKNGKSVSYPAMSKKKLAEKIKNWVKGQLIAVTPD